jgi:hypothetical protein
MKLFEYAAAAATTIRTTAVTVQAELRLAGDE